MSNHELATRANRSPKRTVRVIDIDMQGVVDADDELQDILNKGLMVIPENELHKFSRGLYSPPG